MADGASEQVRIEFQVDDETEAQGAEDLLKQVEATGIETTGEGQEGILPIMIVVGAIAAIAAVADAITRWRASHMCQEMIDARENKIVVTKNCSIKDGRIVVISADAQKVEIHDVPNGIDISKVVEAALKSGADAVKAAAEAAGAKATPPQPAGVV